MTPILSFAESDTTAVETGRRRSKHAKGGSLALKVWDSQQQQQHPSCYYVRLELTHMRAAFF